MRNNFFFTILLFFVALTACNPIAFSPESAAVQNLLNDPEVVADSIRVHQVQPWEARQIVLVSYLAQNEMEQMSCEAVFEMERTPGGWRTGGSGAGCSSPPNTEPVTYGSGSQGIAPDAISHASGLVTLGAAQEVEITWPDGVTQRVPVVNGSYMALRAGRFHMIARVEVLDAAGAVIHEIEIMPDVQKLP